jgi:hypothetical protein
MITLIVLGAFFLFTALTLITFTDGIKTEMLNRPTLIQKRAIRYALTATVIFAVVWWAYGPQPFIR